MCGFRHHNCSSAGHHNGRYILKSAKCGKFGEKIVRESYNFIARKISRGYHLQPSYFIVEKPRPRKEKKLAKGHRTNQEHRKSRKQIS